MICPFASFVDRFEKPEDRGQWSDSDKMIANTVSVWFVVALCYFGLTFNIWYAASGCLPCGVVAGAIEAFFWPLTMVMRISAKVFGVFF